MLDGVRGLAILAVLLYHGVLYSGSRSSHFIDQSLRDLVSFGWAGVDLFFVLSGFLITGILLDSRTSPTYYRSFYARRVLRIFPLYFACLAGFIFVLPLVGRWDSMVEAVRQNQFWYWTYLVNWRIGLQGWSEFFELGHFWSLAVEEQFYMVWPFVVLTFRPATLAKICIACVVGALALRVWLVFSGYPIGAYVLTPCRLDALSLGALLAIGVRNPASHAILARFAPRVLVVCFVAIASIFVLNRSFWPTGAFTLTLGLSIVALASASLMATLLFRPEARWLAGFFRSSPMRFLGKYSYGIYVIHHPVIIMLGRSRLGGAEWRQFGDTEIMGQLLAVTLGIGLSVGLALTSWYLLETPFLRLKSKFPYRTS
jgi:peptidoglycan/LPS O-acetylase OafA/YrhL